MIKEDIEKLVNVEENMRLEYENFAEALKIIQEKKESYNKNGGFQRYDKQEGKEEREGGWQDKRGGHQFSMRGGGRGRGRGSAGRGGYKPQNF